MLKSIIYGWHWLSYTFYWSHLSSHWLQFISCTLTYRYMPYIEKIVTHICTHFEWHLLIHFIHLKLKKNPFPSLLNPFTGMIKTKSPPPLGWPSLLFSDVYRPCSRHHMDPILLNHIFSTLNFFMTYLTWAPGLHTNNINWDIHVQKIKMYKSVKMSPIYPIILIYSMCHAYYKVP